MDRFFHGLSGGYRRLLAAALKYRYAVIIIATIMFCVSLGIISKLRKEFVPSQDQSMFFCRLQTPEGSSIGFTDQRFIEAEKFIMNRPEVLRYFSAIGGFGGGEVNRGQIFVTLKEPPDRPAVEPYKHRPSQKDIMAFFRKELNKIKDLKVIIQDPSLSGFSAQRGFPIELTILGPEWTKLAELRSQIQEKMSATGLMTDIDTNFQEGIPEIRIYPNREQAAKHGVNMEAIGRTVNAMMASERVAKYTQGGHRYDVRIRLIPSQRVQAQDMENLSVWNNFGEMVQLKDVVTINEEKTPLSITRRNRERSISIFANIAPGISQSDAMAATNKIVKEVLPEHYHASYGGNAQTFQESFNSLFFILWLGILVAYMVLASQFNSYKDPVTVLIALPFSVTGALIALWITGQSLNIYSFIGIILLMGIVKKNSILLVNFTNQLKEKGINVRDALLEACPIRLRPILMTSLATIAAAVPPALALGSGAEVLKPMATVVIGGVIFSTFFTLFVVPGVYFLLTQHKLSNL